jgi:prolyl-tRNA synthetase
MEKEHVEGFSPELAVVTHGGGEELAEKLVVRPTSETLMYHYFSKWISSWRDLPLKVNQWSNVVRWELRSFPFLRTSEFLWQEGHTVHATYKEGAEQAFNALKVYEKFFREVLAIPVFIGKKSEKEKFAGSLYSMSCEALLLDGNALQIATSHNLGQNFSQVFEVGFQNQNGEKDYAWQTSWGLSTRALGGMFLTHMDEKGLVIPPRVAPVQVIIIPIGVQKNEEILKIAERIKQDLNNADIRTRIDNRDRSPGWKFNDSELKGVPIRLEIGPRDVEVGTVEIARRDTGDKNSIPFDQLTVNVQNLLEDIQGCLYKKAQLFIERNSCSVEDYEEFKKIIQERRGFIWADWCGSQTCEEIIKDETKATTRCIPFEDGLSNLGKCIKCGEKAHYRPIWARSY